MQYNIILPRKKLLRKRERMFFKLRKMYYFFQITRTANYFYKYFFTFVSKFLLNGFYLFNLTTIQFPLPPAL